MERRRLGLYFAVFLLATAACSGSGEGASGSTDAATTANLPATTSGSDLESSTTALSSSAPATTGTTSPPSTALAVPDWAEGFDSDGFSYFIDQVVG